MADEEHPPIEQQPPTPTQTYTDGTPLPDLLCFDTVTIFYLSLIPSPR